MEVKEGEFRVLYECDPDKHTKCSKQSCHINGGPCHQTKNAMYAKDTTRATMVIPMSQEQYDELVASGDMSLEIKTPVINRAERRKHKHGRRSE